MSAPSLTTTLVTAFLLLLWLILAALPILFCCSPCEFVKLTEAAKKIVFAEEDSFFFIVTCISCLVLVYYQYGSSQYFCKLFDPSLWCALHFLLSVSNS